MIDQSNRAGKSHDIYSKWTTKIAFIAKNWKKNKPNWVQASVMLFYKNRSKAESMNTTFVHIQIDSFDKPLISGTINENIVNVSEIILISN